MLVNVVLDFIMVYFVMYKVPFICLFGLRMDIIYYYIILYYIPHKIEEY